MNYSLSSVLIILLVSLLIWAGYYFIVQNKYLTNLIGSPEQNFWKWFKKNLDLYYNSKNEDKELLDELSGRLKKIDNNFCYEFSSVRKDGKREFVISADGIKSSFPKLINFVDMAPQLDKWEIIPFRQRSENLDSISIEIGDIKLNFTDIFFDYVTHEDKIDVTLYIKNLPDDKDAYYKYMQAIYIVLDSVLGEYDTEMQVGGIELKKITDDLRNKLLPLNKMPQIFDDYFSKD